MIIAVSIVDKHKPRGRAYVGTYMFEVPYDANSHFDFLTVAAPAEEEAVLQRFCGRLLRKTEVPNAVNGRGEPLH